MQRWIFCAISLLVWSCGSHKVPVTVSLNQKQVKMGRIVELKVEHAPDGWSGEVVNNKKHIHIDARNLSLAVNSENGFSDRGIYDLFVVLVDRGGYEIPVADRSALRLEVSPTSVRLDPDTDETGPAGGSAEIRITAADDYHWSATNLPRWIELTPAAEGTGRATIEFKAAPNPTQQKRSARIGIGDAILTITQFAAPLAPGKPVPLAQVAAKSAADLRKRPAGSNPPAARVTFDKTTVKAGDDVQLHIDQIPTVWSGELMVNSNRIFVLDSKTFKVRATPANGFSPAGPTDLYLLLLDGNGGQIPLPNNGFFQVTVDAEEVTLDPVNANFTPQRGSGRFKVQAKAGYEWSAGAVPDWVRIDLGKTGSGSGAVSYTVGENTTNDARSASLTVGDAVYRITQARPLTVQVPFHDAFHYPAPPPPAGYVADTITTTAPPNRWNWDAQPGQNPEITLSDDGSAGSASMVILQPRSDKRAWATQAYLPHLSLQTGLRYKVSARMKAENPGAVSFVLGQSTAPFQGCGLDETFQVTNVWSLYQAEFAVRGEGCYSLNNRFAIQAGKIQGKLWIADFSVVRVQ